MYNIDCSTTYELYYLLIYTIALTQTGVACRNRMGKRSLRLRYLTSLAPSTQGIQLPSAFGWTIFTIDIKAALVVSVNMDRSLVCGLMAIKVIFSME